MSLSRKEQGALLAVILLIVAGLAVKGMGGGAASVVTPGPTGWQPLGQVESRHDAAPSGVAAGASSDAAGGIDINTATSDDFQHLPGLGPAKAEAIVATRQKLGGFKSIDDLMKAPGIGAKTLDKFRTSLRLGAASSAQNQAGAPAATTAPSGAQAATSAPTAAPASAAAVSADPATSLPASGIDINTASPALLETLPGIGPAKAQAIVATRQSLGGFKSIDQLTEVPGIGAKTLEKLRPMVTVAAAPTMPANNAVPVAASVAPAAGVAIPVSASAASAPFAPPSDGHIDLNNAGVSELQQLPGIGEVLARRIVAFRNAHGRFRYVSELGQVSGIGPKKLQAVRDLVKCGP